MHSSFGIGETTMPTVVWDCETFSDISLKDHGAHIYATHPSTGVHFICFAVDNGEVQTWRPGDPAIPEPFAKPAGYRFVSHNWTFENAILQHILIPRYGFVPIPWENQDCAMRFALASTYPAELGLCCEALGLPYRKDPEARKAMLRLSRPQTAKKRKKPVDPAQRERDLALLLGRCQSDVEATRAVYRSKLLRPLLPEERALLLLNAKINERGICANLPFLKAVRDLAIKERNAVNVRLNELTVGVVTSVDQVQRIKEAINARGHEMTTLGKRSVAATLAHDPDDYVRELLQLRQQGAYASVRMAKRLLGYADPADGRIRGALRIYGAGPGRWSSPGPQLHNLRQNDTGYPGSLIQTVTAGDRAELARCGSPLAVTAEMSRGALCAKPGHGLSCADLSAIESRLAWQAGETWKLDAYRHYDATGDKSREPYRVIAGRMLNKDAADIVKAERQQGKSAELACGFGGAIGAWRRIAGNDGRSDEEVLAIIKQWRDAHPAIRAFWKNLARAARVAIRASQPIQVGGGDSRPAIVAAFDGDALALQLPSGRAINYPGARLVPNRKFEDGDSDIVFFDNARGQWKRVRAWFGTLVENVVQGTARDLLAAALLRFEARGLPVVFHCHDEVVIEVPAGAITDREVLAILLAPPPWAAGLPLGGKVHAGPIYFEEPDEPVQPKDITAAPVGTVERQLDTFVTSAEPLPAAKGIEQGADEDYLASLDETTAPLTDLVTLSMDSSNHVSCPFHDDPNPSCSIYADHFYCHACGARGTRLNWLIEVEGMTQTEALNALQDWTGFATVIRERPDAEERRQRALALWNKAKPIAGTIAAQYLSETRGIDVSRLPPTIDEVLRFHSWCPFGSGAYPCLVAVMRDPVTDAPAGIHRIALAQENGVVTKIERRALGGMGVVKLWPVNGDCRLAVGEGIETVLAAATQMSFRGAPLTPAWAAIHTYGVASLPVLDGVEQLIQLIDNDENNAGQGAAEASRQRWSDQFCRRSRCSTTMASRCGTAKARPRRFQPAFGWRGTAVLSARYGCLALTRLSGTSLPSTVVGFRKLARPTTICTCRLTTSPGTPERPGGG
jgi:DNA polymerase